MRECQYNNQRDNYNFEGKDPGGRQCFSTSSIMAVSYATGARIPATDATIKAYHDDLEQMVGSPGLGEEMAATNKEIKGHSSRYWIVQQEGINRILSKNGFQKKAVFRSGTLKDIDEALRHRPVILGTKKIGGLSGGHIILVLEKQNNEYICHDPFGDACTRYASTQGDYVRYSAKLLEDGLKAAKERFFNYMYIEDK